MLSHMIARNMMVTVAMAFLYSSPARAIEAPAGFTPLFNGKDLSGWHGMGHFSPYKLDAMSEEERATKRATDLKETLKHWSVDGDEIVNDGKGPYLTTDREYGDIELRLVYKTAAKGDSGIYLKATPQVQIWDFTREGGKWKIGADKGSGGLYNNSARSGGKDPLVLADRPFGEWNSFRILQIGARTTVYLNGRLVVDNVIMDNFWIKKKPLRSKGPIQLQTHGGEIRWRNIFVREIPAEEANKILQASRTDGFESIFDGKTFGGWKEPGGEVKNYTIKDGALMCKMGKGSTLHTVKTYSDFVARLEFKLPHHGNNGLAIRYPGGGDTAYKGFCELQVLDTPTYEDLDPRQAHGSAYGMVAAERGYLRPTGQWNYQEVTVKGMTVKVELNGSVILDADLSKVDPKTFMGKSAHPGLERKEGHFGFAGHGAQVEFRNVSIKRLD